MPQVVLTPVQSPESTDIDLCRTVTIQGGGHPPPPNG